MHENVPHISMTHLKQHDILCLFSSTFNNIYNTAACHTPTGADNEVIKPNRK